MSQYACYIICATPRSGSTLLREMLAASGVAGCPNSYFRRQDIGYWAERWGLSGFESLDTAAFDRTYLEAMLHAGRNGTGIFGLRIMWGSMADVSRRLDRALGGRRDVADRLTEAFGPVLFIHLSRGDKVAQAVSLLRAEQSGLWHLAADGSVLEGETTPRTPNYDGARLAQIVASLQQDDAAWTAFFETNRITPLRLDYDGVTADPQAALADVLEALARTGRSPPPSRPRLQKWATHRAGRGPNGLPARTAQEVEAPRPWICTRRPKPMAVPPTRIWHLRRC